MKRGKQSKPKQLLVSVQKVRTLTPESMREAVGGYCACSMGPTWNPCSHSNTNM